MVSDTLTSCAALRALGTPQELGAQACAGIAPAVRPRGNSHVHLPPNFSAFESVAQVVQLAAEQKIGVLGVSNYYDYSVYQDFAALARKANIFPLYGLEVICLIDELVKAGVKINDPGNPGKLYLCGKGITRFEEMTAEAKRLLGQIRHNDSTRMAAMIDKLARVFAERGLETGLTEAKVIDMVVRRHGCPREAVYLQERHICQAFQEAFFAQVEMEDRTAMLGQILGVTPKAKPDDHVAVQNEIRSHLMKAGKPAFVEETFVSPAETYKLILELGGIPCYPTLADGASPLCGYEDPVEKLIETVKAAGIYMAEFIPLRNKPEMLSHYVKTMRAAGLVITGGTEHNTLDLVPIEPACVGGAPVPEDVKEIFWEGSCVVAAHQFLTLHGQCGYVDAQGRLNPAYASDEARIDSFRRLGAAVIERYYQTKDAE